MLYFQSFALFAFFVVRPVRCASLFSTKSKMKVERANYIVHCSSVLVYLTSSLFATRTVRRSRNLVRPHSTKFSLVHCSFRLRRIERVNIANRERTEWTMKSGTMNKERLVRQFARSPVHYVNNEPWTKHKVNDSTKSKYKVKSGTLRSSLCSLFFIRGLVRMFASRTVRRSRNNGSRIEKWT